MDLPLSTGEFLNPSIHDGLLGTWASGLVRKCIAVLPGEYDLHLVRQPECIPF
jgi:hypothetical protein